MPFGAIAGAVAAPIVGGVASSLFGPSSTASGGGDSLYTPTGLSSADQGWQQLLAQNLGTQGDMSQLLGLYQGSLNNELGTASGYGANYQTNANTAGAQYNNLADTMMQQSGLNYGTQQSLLNAGQQVYNMGLDPNQAQYNLSLNNLTQQTGATNSMYGLGSSAAGAGVQNQALSNFNIGWNTQQLQNAATGLSAYDQAANAAGNYGQLANQQAAAAPGYQLQAGSTPYNVGMTIAGVPASAASQYATGLETGPIGSANSIQSQIIPYLNYGQGATSNAYNMGSQSAGALGSAVSSGITGLGNSVQNAGGFANLFGGTTGSFGGGDFSGAFTSSPYYSGGGNTYGFTM